MIHYSCGTPVFKEAGVSKYPFLLNIDLSSGITSIARIGELWQVFIAVSLEKKNLKDLNQ